MIPHLCRLVNSRNSDKGQSQYGGHGGSDGQLSKEIMIIIDYLLITFQATLMKKTQCMYIVERCPHSTVKVE